MAPEGATLDLIGQKGACQTNLRCGTSLQLCTRAAGAPLLAAASRSIPGQDVTCERRSGFSGKAFGCFRCGCSHLAAAAGTCGVTVWEVSVGEDPLLRDGQKVRLRVSSMAEAPAPTTQGPVWLLAASLCWTPRPEASPGERRSCWAPSSPLSSSCTASLTAVAPHHRSEHPRAALRRT